MGLLVYFDVPTFGVIPIALSNEVKLGVDPITYFGKLASGGINVRSGILSYDKCRPLCPWLLEISVDCITLYASLPRLVDGPRLVEKGSFNNCFAVGTLCTTSGDLFLIVVGDIWLCSDSTLTTFFFFRLFWFFAVLRVAELSFLE